MRRSLAMKLSATGLAALVGFSVLSVAQGGLFVSEKEIERQYRIEWLSMKKHVPIYPDKRVQNYAACVASQIVDTLDDEFHDLDWEIIVFDDDQQNAQVMPGGKIAVYSGILSVADTPAEFAAVLGHEVAHLTQGHVMERQRRAARADAVVLLGNAATGLGGMIQDATTLALVLPFNRDQESEADAVGMQYMARAGYDPRAALELWHKMYDLNGDRPQPEFTSSHPAPETRMRDLAPHLAGALVDYNKALDSGKLPNCGL